MSLLGRIGEELVLQHYEKRGFILLARNFVFPHGKQMGELDLVFRKDKEIVFVEVKTRSNYRFGGPFESVDRKKQLKLVRTCKLYMQIHKQYQDYNFRIDVAAVDIDNKSSPVIILSNAIEDLD